MISKQKELRARREWRPLFWALLISISAHAFLLAFFDLGFVGRGEKVVSPVVRVHLIRGVSPNEKMVSDDTNSFVSQANRIPGKEVETTDVATGLEVKDPGGGAHAAPYYFRHSEIDIPPYPLNEFPDLSDGKSYSLAGKVVLELWVDDTGRVDRVNVLDTDLPEIQLGRVVEMISEQKFTSAVLHGQKVHSRVIGEIRFNSPVLPGNPKF